MHEVSVLLSARVRPAASVWVLQASEAEKSFCVLGRAGVGVILFIFKLSSTNLPGTDAPLGCGNPFEAHKENAGSGSFYTVPVLLAFVSPTRTDKDKEV